MEKYTILQFLGRGAYGTAQLARRVADSSRVVLKRVELPEEERAAEDAARLGAKEVQALASCRHPLVVHYFESFELDCSLIIAMEYVPGGTLRAFLKQQTKLLDEAYVICLLAQLISALSHIHARRLLHRDLTSRNVLLSADHRVAKIADFGLSKMLSSRCSRAASVVGTPEYMSPELCKGEVYGVQSDVWALGCVLYELLTLHTPFQASTVPLLVLSILRGYVSEPSTNYSEELRSLMRGMLASNPTNRLTLSQVGASPSVAIQLVKMCTSLGAISI